MQSDEQAIRDLVARWLAATKAGDLATVLGLMADDVVFLVPGAEPFGKQEFAAASKAMQGVELKAKAKSSSCTCWAIGPGCRSRLRVVVTPPGGAARWRGRAIR